MKQAKLSRRPSSIARMIESMQVRASTAATSTTTISSISSKMSKKNLKSTIPPPNPDGIGYFFDTYFYGTNSTCASHTATLINQIGERIGQCNTEGATNGTSKYIFACDTKSNTVSFASFNNSIDCSGEPDFTGEIDIDFTACFPLTVEGISEAFSQSCLLDSEYNSSLPVEQQFPAINFVLDQTWTGNKCNGKPFSYIAWAPDVCDTGNFTLQCNAKNQPTFTSYIDDGASLDKSCNIPQEPINLLTNCEHVPEDNIASSFSCSAGSGLLDDTFLDDTGTSSSSGGTSDGSLSGGAVAGVVIAILLILSAASYAVYYYLYKPAKVRKGLASRESELNQAFTPRSNA